MNLSLGFLDELYEVILDRIRNPRPNSYTALLASKGLDYIAKKIGEEATELVIELVRGDKRRIIEETADLLYHVLVGLALRGIRPRDVVEELARRRKSRGESTDS